MVNLINEYLSGEKMPFEALLFYIYHIWLLVMVLTALLIIGTGIHFGLDISLVLITLGLFILYLVPIVSIVQNIIYNKKDTKKILCCIPLLIVGILHTISAFAVQIKIVVYEGHPDLLIYNLLLPIQKLVALVADPLVEGIFNMEFPYNLLIPTAFYIVFFPFSLLIYLLPSIDYNRKKVTKEIKLIAILPLICVIIPVIVQTVRMRFGLIDDVMLKFFWVEIFLNIGKLVFFLMPLLGILYIKHYNKVKDMSKSCN